MKSHSPSTIEGIKCLDTFDKRTEYEILKEIFSNEELINKLEQDYESNNDIQNKIFIHNDKSIKDIRKLINKKTINIWRLFGKINCKLQYINSGSSGHFFKGIIFDENGQFKCNFGMKVTMYNKSSANSISIYDATRPENVEVIISQILSKHVFNKETPHILLPIRSFYTNIEPFLTIKCDGANPQINDEKNRYNKFLKSYKLGKYNNEVSINITEYANQGDFLEFIRKKYKTLTLSDWKVYFFQIISTLAIIQSNYPNFKHNDLKANNVLVHKIQKSTRKIIYTVCNKKYELPNIGYMLKIWDFDFSCIGNSVINRKVSYEWAEKSNINSKKNLYYDIHFFFNTLTNKGFFPEILTDTNFIHNEVKEFIRRVVPYKYSTLHCNDHGRLKTSEEHMSPQGILENDLFFKEFRHNH